MPNEQLQVVESLRRRPLRTAVLVGVIALCFASGAALRRRALRQESLDAWSARSSVAAQLTATGANAWIRAREGDARLLAASGSHKPQLFGVLSPHESPYPAAELSASLLQSLTALDQVHPYSSIWLFDRSGKLIGTSPGTATPPEVRSAAIASLALDSGKTIGPFAGLGRNLSVAFAQRVVAAPPSGGPPASTTGQVIGAVVLTSDARPLFAELATWTERSRSASTSLLVPSGDSIFEYAITPDRTRATLLGAWSQSTAPRSTAAVFATKSDSSVTIAGQRAEFTARLDRLPWALTQRDSVRSVFASVDGRLGTEMSTGAAIIFMVAIIVIARQQTSRERKLIEVAESEMRYRLLADNATDVIVRHAPDGRIVYVSPAIYATLGYRPRQLEGRHLSELSDPDDPTTMDHVLDQLRAANGASRAEHRLRHADGRYVWFETTGRAVRDHVWGNMTEIVTVSRDIEARKQAEEALRASEEEYRLLFDANPLPMWAFDANTSRFIAVNDAGVKHYGYSREEFLRMTIFDIRPPEDALSVHEHMARVVAGATDIHGSRHRKKDGTLMHVDLTVHAVKLSGRMTWLVLVKDITQAMRTAVALRESNEFVSTLFDSSPVAILATDLDFRIVKWNGAAERLFGWTAEEVIGKPYPLASDAMQSEVKRNRELAIREGRFTEMHAHRCRKDGTTVEVSMSVGTIHNSDRQPNGFVMIAADLSERSRLELQLRHSQKMDAVGQLAGGVAHDFNNLLTVVTGYAGILLSELPKDEPIRADIQEIMGAANRAAVLTRQLLAFSRQQVLEPRVLDLNEVVEGMEQMLRRVLPADIKVHTSLDPALGAVNADPGQLEQVLMNLIVNARDAMPMGGTLTIETMNFKLDAADRNGRADEVPGEYAMLAVSDTGSGMTKAVQARIFEPFFTTKERGKGTGLGLSTAHGIVTQSGGYLSVYSEPGVGTTFKMCLPKVPEEAATIDLQNPDAAITTGAEVILLVEDDAPVRITAARILERAGYTVLAASNGNEALEIFENQSARIDLLLTDMIMPEMSGRELVARIRAREPEVAALVMSGYTEQSSRNRDFLDDGSAFIQKPFTPEGLAAKVRSAINASVLNMV